MFIAITLIVYFIPTIVANLRDRQVGTVAVLNLFLGWTVIFWVVALAIAASDRHPRVA